MTANQLRLANLCVRAVVTTKQCGQRNKQTAWTMGIIRQNVTEPHRMKISVWFLISWSEQNWLQLFRGSFQKKFIYLFIFLKRKI